MNISIVELYKSGKTIAEIAEIKSKKWIDIYKVLLTKSIEIQEEYDICDAYVKEKKAVAHLAKEYGIHVSTIYCILKKHDIKTRGRRKYQLNEHYFDEIDTPTKAYILGFFYADGCNFIPKRTISMSLQEEDAYILERIRKEIESERPLEFLDYSNKHDFGYTYKNQYRLLLFSAHMGKTLEKHGMYQNKSLILEFPDWLNKELIPHFIRGYFDGDGCVHFASNGNCSITVTSTEKFCLKLQKHIESTLKINTCLYDASCHNGITKVFNINGANQVKTFLDYIYKDADIYLERKYQTYINKYYNFSHVA